MRPWDVHSKLSVATCCWRGGWLAARLLQGYDAELEMVIEGDDEEVAYMIEAVQAMEGIKLPTIKKFKRELAKVRGKGEKFD